MSFTEEQTAALKLLAKRLPEDLAPTYQTVDPSRALGDSPWLRSMVQIAKDWENKAASHYNLQVRQDRPDNRNSVARRILSSEGFPAWVDVGYATPPPLSYLTTEGPRDIKHIVFHSFGHSWHAMPVEGAKNWGGWMNRVTAGEGVEPYEHEGETVYIAKGSDPFTLTHPSRVASGVRAALGPASRATPHFFVDRSGSLLVVGDVGDVMFVSDAINDTSISIMLEEAFYLVKDPREEKAIWSPDGTPPGTGGNIQYFTFSPPQLYTLSILCKKLETAFPNIAGRNIDFTRRGLTADSPAGYTMHDFVSGSKHVDISPHFLTRALWNSFFALVDTHTQINETNIWKPVDTYKNTGIALANAPLADVPVNLVTERLLQDSRDLGLALQRSLHKATASKSSLLQDAGDTVLLESKKIMQVAANTYNSVQQTEQLPRTLVEEDLSDDEQGGWDEEHIWG